MLANCCSLNLLVNRATALAHASNSFASDCPAVANAHTALARSCGLSSANLGSVACANDDNSYPSDLPAVENAQAVLPSACILKLPMRYLAVLANLVNKVTF
eukprot:gnl/TRDRNA2_/TRDRNA2_176473_c0_seq9.p2 gnl/TRDRNA2_/TRDRNA2_176473_c0~~gnl/TRDRNA2_/TRDRNA2_176473_c0_seq9.p2  ORF type:complete len:102 (+),score=11.93 gnl/TRDRNA2_/TRDRNA2_176473_c0_seq9:482-787(+)